jgi:hypothetical protein
LLPAWKIIQRLEAADIRFFGACSCRLDLKPREIGVWSMEVMPFASGASCRAKAWHRCAPVRLFKERAIYSWCKTIGVSISFSPNFAKLKKSWQAAWRWRVSTRVGQYPAPSPDPGAYLGGKASSPMGQQLPSPYGTAFSEGSGSRSRESKRPRCALLRAMRQYWSARNQPLGHDGSLHALGGRFMARRAMGRADAPQKEISM